MVWFGPMEKGFIAIQIHQDCLYGRLESKNDIMFQINDSYKFKNFQRNINLTNAHIIFRMLSQEAGRADRNRHYGLYIDGDIAKLPGGMLFKNRY